MFLENEFPDIAGTLEKETVYYLKKEMCKQLRQMYHAIMNNSRTTRMAELQYSNRLNIVIKKHIIFLHFHCNFCKR